MQKTEDKKNQPEHISRIMLRVLSGLFYAPALLPPKDESRTSVQPGQLNFKRKGGDSNV